MIGSTETVEGYRKSQWPSTPVSYCCCTLLLIHQTDRHITD